MTPVLRLSGLMIPFGYGSPMRVQQRSSAEEARLDWSPLWCLVWVCVRACQRSAIALCAAVRTWAQDGLEWHRVSSWARGIGEVSGLIPVLVPVVSACPTRPIPRGSGTVGLFLNADGTRGHVFADSPATWRRDRRALTANQIISPPSLPHWCSFDD
jgi:hypothetical protein